MEWSAKDIEYLMDAVKYNSAKDIANVLGVSLYSVQHRISSLQKSGTIPKYSKSDKRENCISRTMGMPIKKALEYLHWELEMPLKSMEEHLGFPRISITRSMKSHGIKWRTISEDNVRRFKDMPMELKQAQTNKANNALRDAPYTPRPHMEGSNNHQWKGGKSACVCAWCGSIFERHAGNIKTDLYNSCSKECKYRLMGLRFSGANSANWKGGKESWRGGDWMHVRSEILKRDNHTCQLCNLLESECIDAYGGSLNVHHKVPFRISKDNSHDNLITLCNRCHKTYEDLWVGIDLDILGEI